MQLSFGIGTRLTCDIPQVKPLNIVIKLVECNGKPVAKLSDSPGKTICHDKAFVRALRKAFDLRRCVKQVNHACAKRPESGRFVTLLTILPVLAAMVTILPFTLRHIYVHNLRCFYRISVPLCTRSEYIEFANKLFTQQEQSNYVGDNQKTDSNISH